MCALLMLTCVIQKSDWFRTIWENIEVY